PNSRRNVGRQRGRGMVSQAFSSLVESIQRTRTIIWLALNAAIVLYVGLACFMFGVPSTVRDAFSHSMALPFVVLAVAAAVGARVVPSMMLPQQRVDALLSREADPRELARDPRTGSLDSERLATIQTLPQYEQRLLAVAQASLVPFIVRLALQESIALYGLVL